MRYVTAEPDDWSFPAMQNWRQTPWRTGIVAARLLVLLILLVAVLFNLAVSFEDS
jgi:hypothetical protein